PEAYERLLALKPSIVVASGGGYHGYWLLDAPHTIHEVDMPEMKWSLKGIAERCGGDKKVAELARILRLPNTINTKPSRLGNVAQVVHVDSVRYGYTDIITQFAKYGRPSEPPVTRTPMGRIGTLPTWVEKYLTTGAPSGERNATLFRVACTCKGIGMSEGECVSLAGNRALMDGLDEGEAERTIASAYGRAVSLVLPRGERWRRQMMGADDHLLRMRQKRDGAV
ncbi:MAG TPA: primase C-terminal domain-containing protein, partial [Aggregatilineales bacterium]|nr:primase C-terminal domain-containing protein [Aggregatilineales bacterium]